MPNRAVFLDTNGWLALLNASDMLHEPALALWGELVEQGATLVATDWVLAETGNGLARTPARRQLSRAVDLFRSSSRSRFLFVSSAYLEKALNLYDHREDKGWGLVDCASFAVMQDLGIAEAFTDDRHFQQAGFRRLLSPF